MLRKDETAVREILWRNPNSLLESNRVCQTPLHLASDWPEGLALLLNASGESQLKLDQHDRFGLAAFVYACAFHSEESLALLLHAGCGLSSHLDPCADLAHALRRCSDHQENMIISEVASRQGRLEAFATHSYQDCIRRPPPSNSTCLDKNIRISNSPFENASISIDNMKTSIFHVLASESLIARRKAILTAEKLFAAGVCEVDKYNEYGLTPLMTFHLGSGFDLEYVAWLISKGADLYRKRILIWKELVCQGASAAHYLARIIAAQISSISCHDLDDNCCEFDLDHVIQALDGLGIASRKLLADILKDDICDQCLCACTVGGCSPFDIFFRDLLYAPLHYDQRPYYSYYCPLEDATTDEIRLIIAMAENLDISQQAQVSLSMQLIQSLTFEEMGLTHTCCSYKCQVNGLYSEIEHEEIAEIREEEALLIQKFDQIVKDLHSQFHEAGLPLLQFMEQYWKPMMLRLKEEETTPFASMDKEYIKQVEGIGVVVERLA